MSPQCSVPLAHYEMLEGSDYIAVLVSVDAAIP